MPDTDSEKDSTKKFFFLAFRWDNIFFNYMFYWITDIKKNIYKKSAIIEKKGKKRKKKATRILIENTFEPISYSAQYQATEIKIR